MYCLPVGPVGSCYAINFFANLIASLNNIFKSIASRRALPRHAGGFNMFIVYTRGMAKLFSEKSMVIVKKYGRLFLRNTTLFFNPNPSLSQETALRRFIPCTLDTSLPNPNSNTFKIGLYQCTHKILVYTRGMAKLFVKKKLGLVQEDQGSYGTLIFSPQPYFFS